MATVPDSSTAPPKRGAAGAWLIVTGFGALAGLLLANPWPYQRPYATAETVPAWVVDMATVRSPTLKPETVAAGYTYRCSECHKLFPSPRETDRSLTQHRDIVLRHGINNRCFNCHHRTSRDAFATDKESPIPYDQPQLLCAKCHGPVYRDWMHGVHGRTNGFWDASRGPVDRKKCIQCHDPHAPAFGVMAPAPGPNTLRMGDRQQAGSRGAETTNPLLIYGQPSGSVDTNPGERH